MQLNGQVAILDPYFAIGDPRAPSNEWYGHMAAISGFLHNLLVCL